MTSNLRSPSILDRLRGRPHSADRVDETIVERNPPALPGQVVDRPRILLVSSDREMAALILGLCEECDWPVRIVLDPTSWAPADDWSPSIALLDERGTDLEPLIERLHKTDEHLAIVTLTNDDDVLTSAHGDLVGGVIHLPIEPEEFRRHILGLQLRRPPSPLAQRRGRLIVVCGSSGGVGTSTVAANLAAALGWAGARSTGTMCALVDGSLHFADQRILLDIPPRASGIVEVAAATDPAMTAEVLRATLVRLEPGLMVLPGPTTIEAGERIDGARFGEIIRTLRTLYPFTVVDVGRELTEGSFLAFTLADEIVLVTRAEVMPLKNARLMLDLLIQMGCSSGQIRLVLNRVGARGSLSLAEAAGIFDRPFAVQLPDDVSTVNYALSHGRPFTFDRRETALAHAVDNLAALFAKESDNHQLDFLKARGFPKGLTELLLSPDRPLSSDPAQLPPDLATGSAGPGENGKRHDPTVGRRRSRLLAHPPGFVPAQSPLPGGDQAAPSHRPAGQSDRHSPGPPTIG
jgi:Flp pilus assembly CpaE family ATPase